MQYLQRRKESFLNRRPLIFNTEIRKALGKQDIPTSYMKIARSHDQNYYIVSTYLDKNMYCLSEGLINIFF